MQLLEPRAHRWTFSQFIRLSEAGHIPDEKIELINGVLVDMHAQSDPHALAVTKLARQLFRVFPEPYWVKVQATQKMGRYSGPEPDFTVLEHLPSVKPSAQSHPLLVVEVSDTSLAYDRSTKRSLYAAAKIEDYWIVNIPDHQLEAYRKPIKDARRRFGWGYASSTIYRSREKVFPLVLPKAGIEVASVLP